VVVADYRADTGHETVQTIKDAEGDALFGEVDVSNPGQVQHLVQPALNAYGGVDIVFNNAGVLLFGTILETQEEAWNRLMSINLTGV